MLGVRDDRRHDATSPGTFTLHYQWGRVNSSGMTAEAVARKFGMIEAMLVLGGYGAERWYFSMTREQARKRVVAIRKRATAAGLRRVVTMPSF
jgi:hypothetical protein